MVYKVQIDLIVKRLIVFFFPVLIMIGGCNQQAKEVRDKSGDVGELKKEVIAIHDTAMAKMNRIFQLKTLLEDELDSANLDPEKVNAIQDLKMADEAMMQWMRNFSKHYGKAHSKEAEIDTLHNNEALMDGLKKEKAKILDVKKQMEASIEKAEGILEK
jgi:peroxiredoxin